MRILDSYKIYIFFLVIFEIKKDTFGIHLPGLSSMVLPPVFVKASSKHKHIGLLEPRHDWSKVHIFQIKYLIITFKKTYL